MTSKNPSKKNLQDKEQIRQNQDSTILSMMPNQKDVIKVQPKKQKQAKSEYGDEMYMGVNQVLVYSYRGGVPTYYVPTYLRMRINRVNQINYIESKAQIQAEIRIWLMIKEFPQIVQDQIINQAKIQINGSTSVELDQIRQPLKLDQAQIRNRSKSAVGFLFSQQMQLNIESDAFWSPFQLVKLYANLQLKKIVLGTGNPLFLQKLKKDQNNELKSGDVDRYNEASVQFNFLDAHPFLQFSFGQVRSLGSFDIAQSLVDMKFSNTDIGQNQQDQPQQDQDVQSRPLNMVGQLLNLKQKVKKQKLESGDISPDAYEHGQILIPLYKYPSTTIINIFVPLYMVAVMSLGVFFQTNDMSNRDGALSTFLLAYIAFLPSIRQSLPETPKIVFTQILVYLQITTSLICFFYSLSVNFQQGYAFAWDSTGPFLVCVALTLLNMVVVIGMFLMHKLVWERSYNKLPKGSKKYIGAKFMNTDDNVQWWNKQCDEQFRDAIQMGLVKPYITKMNKKKSVPNLFTSFLKNEQGSGSLMSAPKQRQNDLLNQKVHPTNY